MFSLGTTEILVILVVALLVIGPSKLPDVARTLGKGMAEFRRMSSDVKKTVDLETKLSDLDRQEKDKEADAAVGPGTEEAERENGQAETPTEDSPQRSGNEAAGEISGEDEDRGRSGSEDPETGRRA